MTEATSGKNRRETAPADFSEMGDRPNGAGAVVVARLCHEVRAALQDILATANMLQFTDLDPVQLRHCETIAGSGQRLLHVLDGYRDPSRAEAIGVRRRTRFEICDLMDSLIADWKGPAERKNLGLFTHVGTDLPTAIVCDADRLREILGNLIDNAVKFTEHGYVAIDVRVDDRAEDKLLLRFEVRDSGIGIEEERQAHLFNGPAPGKDARDQGGSGLSLCRDLTRSLGGEIGVTSDPARGSIFWITVACDVADTQQASALPADPVAAAPAAAEEGLRRLKILIADDNDTNQIIIRDILEHQGHVVDTVINGREAVRSVSRQHYDLIFMDVQMPLMDGLQATRRIREDLPQCSDVPIIALTASAMKGDEERCLFAGMNDYVSKPITIDQIVGVVAKHTGVGAAAN